MEESLTYATKQHGWHCANYLRKSCTGLAQCSAVIRTRPWSGIVPPTSEEAAQESFTSPERNDKKVGLFRLFRQAFQAGFSGRPFFDLRVADSFSRVRRFSGSSLTSFSK